MERITEFARAAAPSGKTTVRWVAGLYSFGTLIVWAFAKHGRHPLNSKYLVYALVVALILIAAQITEIRNLGRSERRPRRAKVARIERFIKKRIARGEALLKQLQEPANQQQFHDNFIAVERWEHDTRQRLIRYGQHWARLAFGG